MALKRKFTIGDVSVYAVLTLFTILCAFPYWVMIAASLSKTGRGLWIENFTLGAYRYIFSTVQLPRSLMVTVIITVVGTALKLLVTSLMAYSLSEKGMPGRTLFLNMVIFTMLFGGGMIPTYFVVRSTGLFNTIWSLIIPGLVSPFNLIVMKNFYQNLPYELKESARIDGCHEIVIMLRIIMPLSLPSLATFGLFYAVSQWNTYMPALLYLTEPKLWPIQVLLKRIIDQPNELDKNFVDPTMTFSNNVRMAVVLFATGPLLCVYPFLQKHFVKGITVGAVKG